MNEDQIFELNLQQIKLLCSLLNQPSEGEQIIQLLKSSSLSREDLKMIVNKTIQDLSTRYCLQKAGKKSINNSLSKHKLIYGLKNQHEDIEDYKMINKLIKRVKLLSELAEEEEGIESFLSLVNRMELNEQKISLLKSKEDLLFQQFISKREKQNSPDKFEKEIIRLENEILKLKQDIHMLDSYLS